MLKKYVEKLEACVGRLKTYIRQLHICGKRNKYAKIDTDARFMRQKKDAMLNVKWTVKAGT